MTQKISNTSIKLIGNNKIKVEKSIFESDRIIVAAGSVPSELDNIKIDENHIKSSTGALSLEKISCHKYFHFH